MSDTYDPTMPYRTRAQEALDRWRELDLAVARMAQDDPRRHSVEETREATQAEYEAIVEQVRGAQAPEPPPWPGRAARST